MDLEQLESPQQDFTNLSPYDFAFINLLKGTYKTEYERLQALMIIIKERDLRSNIQPIASKSKKASLGQLKVRENIKPPLKKSKRELIFNLLKEQRLYPEIVEALTKRKYTYSPSEIYSVRNKYFE